MYGISAPEVAFSSALISLGGPCFLNPELAADFFRKWRPKPQVTLPPSAKAALGWKARTRALMLLSRCCSSNEEGGMLARYPRHDLTPSPGGTDTRVWLQQHHSVGDGLDGLTDGGANFPTASLTQSWRAPQRRMSKSDVVH